MERGEEMPYGPAVIELIIWHSPEEEEENIF